jgi:hypothetical protein
MPGSGISLTSDSVVETILDMSNWTTNAVVTFTTNTGAQDVFHLTNGITIDNDGGSAGLTGSQSDYSGLGTTVTTQKWWSNGGNHLNVQTFTLPAAWNGELLTSMTVTSAGTYDYLFGLQVDTTAGGSGGTGGADSDSVPEPMSLALLGAGLLGMMFMRRQRAI